ncbi:MAG TPA: vitamin K epoxide reductase family protein, partial [Cellulomonas sp.]
MTSVTDHSAPTGRGDLDDDLDDLLVRRDDDPDGPEVQRWRRRTAIEMVVSGALGLFTSFVLSIEAWRIAADSDVTLSCDINSVISCGTVARSPQAQLLGFPNAFLGIAFEVVVITLSVAVIGGVRFPRWFMVGTQALYTVALLFAYWLFLQSYFVIGALCPWCLLITVTTTLVWAGLT